MVKLVTLLPLANSSYSIATFSILNQLVTNSFQIFFKLLWKQK